MGRGLNKAIFMDRDGTINVEKHYLHRIEDFEFLPGAVEGMRILQAKGYKLIMITNQSGIGRGYYSEKEFELLNNWMVKELERCGVIIDGVYYCPHLPDAKIEKYRMVCNCRKPALGLYEKAIIEHDINVDQSWAIGDKIRDCGICEKTGCRGYLIGKNENVEIVNRVKNGGYRNIAYAEDLKSAAEQIVKESME